VIAQEFQLGFQDLLNGPPDDGVADIDGQGLDRVEVDVESRTFVAVSAPRNDFAPPVGHVAELGQILGLSLGERHRVFVLELGCENKMGNSA
jgi:hypothetical protein